MEQDLKSGNLIPEHGFSDAGIQMHMLFNIAL